MSSISDFLGAVELGAGSIYHRVVQAVPRVTAWTADHPEIKPLLADGVALATSVLGCKDALAAEAVLAALKVLAAKDATVQSGH